MCPVILFPTDRIFPADSGWKFLKRAFCKESRLSSTWKFLAICLLLLLKQGSCTTSFTAFLSLAVTGFLDSWQIRQHHGWYACSRFLSPPCSWTVRGISSLAQYYWTGDCCIWYDANELNKFFHKPDYLFPVARFRYFFNGMSLDYYW